MKRANKIIAVTLVTAFIFISMCFPASAATEYGVYGQGGFEPPFNSLITEEDVCIFIPTYISSDGVYIGRYYHFPSTCKVRLIIYQTDSSSSFYHYAFQVNSGSDDSVSYYWSGNTAVKWRSDVSMWYGETVDCTYSEDVGSYGTAITLFQSTNKYIDNDGTFHSYVVDIDGYDSSWYSDHSLFDWYPQSGISYYVPTPLVSGLDDWAYNYGYETPEQEQEAIEQSRYDAQNQLISEGFTRMEGAIINAANQIEQAITNAAGEIINAGSDMPTLDTNNDWMNDSLTKVNEWVSQLEAFEEQMKAAEAENSSNMAQAEAFINGFFEVVPKGIVAALTMFLVMIVVVKAVGR